jgi:TRAP-type transport system small permease protein
VDKLFGAIKLAEKETGLTDWAWPAGEGAGAGVNPGLPQGWNIPQFGGIAMQVLESLSDWISWISIKLGCVFLLIMSASLFLQVVLRYCFNSGLTASDEIARYSVIWAVCLAGNVLIKEGSLIKVDFLDHLWAPRFIKIRDATYQVLIVVLLVVLVIEGWKLAVEGLNSRITSMNLQWFYPYLAVPVGALLMLFQVIYRIAASMTKPKA